MMRRTRNPIDTLAGLLFGALLFAMAICGIGGMLFTAGWLVLQGYDRLATWLGA